MSERSELEAAVAALEQQRSVLGDAVVEAALAPMRDKLAALEKAEAPAAPSDDGERKFVTMIFADLSGSTALGEVMDPEEIRDLLNGCFDRLVPRVKEFGGTIDKFIGDNIMALFGAPVAHENDPERALRAAWAMMQALDEFNQDMGVDLGMHMGVNSGLVIAGGVGSEGERQYSVLGDAVNVAARLEGASETGEILVGPDTRRLAGPAFEYVDLEPISVKGRHEPVAISRLLGVKAGRHSARGIEGLSSPMVGRDAEAARFSSMLDGLVGGRGGLVAVVAEAGVGKSRFVGESRDGSPGGVSWSEGAALAHTTNVPYSLAKDLVRDLVGVAPDASHDELSGSLAGKLALGMSAEDATSEWPFLARMLDLPLADAATAVIAQYDGSPEILVQRTADAFVRLMTAVSSAPSVVVWEDLHWADGSSLKLLEAVLPLTDRLPLLLVMMFRPGDSAMSGLHQQLVEAETLRTEVIELFALSRDESESLVDSLLNIENLPASTKDMLVSKAEGNPLFLEELVRALIDAGLVVVGVDGPVATDAIHDLDALDIPDTVHGVIAARIDRLPAHRKATLQSASVLGRVFQRRILGRVAMREVDEDLGELQRLDFITRDGDAGASTLTEFLFKHVFTQEAAYNGILLAHRRDLHAAAAEAIEVLFPDQLEELSATLARHHEAADNKTKAAQHLLTAAQRAANAYANDDALGLISRALGIVDAGGTDYRAPLLQLRELIFQRTGPQEARHADLEELAAIAAATGDESLRLETLLREAEYLADIGEWEAQIETARNALELADDLEEPAAVARARLMIGFSLGRLSKFAEAEEELARGLEIAKGHDLSAQRMTLLTRLALVRFGRKDHVGARTLLEEALEIAKRDGHRRDEGNIHQNLGIQTVALCDFDYCRRHFHATIAIAQEMGDLPLEVAGIASLGEAERLDANYEAALSSSRRALKMAEAGGQPFWIAVQNRATADSLTLLGRAAEAIAVARRAVDLYRSLFPPPHVMDAVTTLALATAATGKTGEAMDVIDEAVSYLLGGGNVIGAAYPFRIYATCLDILQAADDPRFSEVLNQAASQLNELYPDGGCLPWMKDIRHHAAAQE